jgi:hypothetical protein
MLRIPVRPSLVVTLLAVSAVSLAAEGNDPTPSATDIIRNVVTTYRSLTSYRDRGVSITKPSSGRGPIEQRLEFETQFVRPDKLRFAWDDITSSHPDKEHFVIWSDGESAWSSFAYAGNKPERAENLLLAVASASGISAGTAHYIPRLLSTELNGVGIDDLEEYSVTGEESIDGVECVKLTGKSRPGADYTISVGRDDNLVRRIIVDHFGTEYAETHTGIVVNGDISDSSFKE